MICIYCHSNENVSKFYANKHYIEICSFCFENICNKTLSCSKCGKILTYVKKDNIFILKNCEINKNGILCNDCLNSVDQSNTGVNFVYKAQNLKDYLYKPNPLCRKMDNQPKNNLYMGIELQVGGSSSRSSVNDFCNSHAGSIFYFKRDASIADYGCQIVTHPCTLNFHMSNKSGWAQIFNDFNLIGLRSGTSTNTGLHIHVNRSFLSNEQIKKLDLFVNYYRNLFEKLSRRTSNHYAEYNIKGIRQWGHPTSDRYTSVNFENSHTVQFRIFSGTNDINQFFASLQLVHAVIMFVDKISYEDFYENKQDVIKKFKLFVFEKAEYEQLKNMIKTLNI